LDQIKRRHQKKFIVISKKFLMFLLSKEVLNRQTIS
jgi:hypothetical protein